MYNNDSVLGFGIRSCTDAPNQAIAGPGDYCLNGSDCTTFLCDSTYYRPSGEFLLAPYCNQHCDTDNDCPQLFPGSGANAFNLRMKCIVTSIDTIQPLVGGYCAPAWCYTVATVPEPEVAAISSMNLALRECHLGFVNNLDGVEFLHCE